MALTVKNPCAMPETWVPSLGQEDPLEEGMATHSGILTWKISQTEEPGRLQSIGRKESDMNKQQTHTQTYVCFGTLNTDGREEQGHSEMGQGQVYQRRAGTWEDE